MYCPYCGERLSEGDNFCTRCGKRLPRPGAPSTSASRGEVEGAPSRPGPSVPSPAVRPSAAVPSYRGPGPGEGAREGGRPRTGGSPLTAALCTAACVLAVACIAAALLAPLVEMPFLAGTSTARGDAVQAVLEVVDPRLSVVAGGLIGSGGLGSFDLARLGVQLADALVDDRVALATGLSVGATGVTALLCAAGVVSTAALRRSTPVLICGCLLAVLLGAAGLGAVAYFNDALVDWLIADKSHLFREMGVSLIPSDVKVVVATPWLVATVACAGAAFVCAVWARRRWACGRRFPR